MGHSYNHERVSAIIAAQAHRSSFLLPVLHEIDDACGCSAPESTTSVTASLHLTQKISSLYARAVIRNVIHDALIAAVDHIQIRGGAIPPIQCNLI